MTKNDLPESLQELYSAERQRPLPGGNAVDALWSKISTQLGGPGGDDGPSGDGGSQGSGSPPVGGTAGAAASSGASSALTNPGATTAVGSLSAVSSWSTIQLAGAVAGALVLGSVGGYQAGVRVEQARHEASAKELRESISEKREVVSRPEPADPPEAPTLENPPANESIEQQATAEVEQGVQTPAANHQGRALRAPKNHAPARGRSRLVQERRILDVAQGALDRGRTEQARSALREHESEYPNGLLREEREAMWIRLLRQSGQELAAEERLDAFEARYPKSLFLNDLGQ